MQELEVSCVIGSDETVMAQLWQMIFVVTVPRYIELVALTGNADSKPIILEVMWN